MANLKEFDPVLFWSNAVLEAHRLDFVAVESKDPKKPKDEKKLDPMHAGPTRTSRVLAIVHLAIYDAYFHSNPAALKASRPSYANLTSYCSAPKYPAGAALQGAVAGAATCCLQALYKGGHAEIAEHIKAASVAYKKYHVGAGVTNAAFDAGHAYGIKIGTEVLKKRKDDGSQLVDGTYQPLNLPGTYLNSPQAGNAGHANLPIEALGSKWGDRVLLFNVIDRNALAARFVPPDVALGGVPQAVGAYDPSKFLSAPGWNQDRDNVYGKGVAPGSAVLTRTPEETLIGIFWGYDGANGLGVPPRLYNQCLHEIAQQIDPAIGFTSFDLAVLLANANMAMADAGILAWLEKYTFHVARPATQLRMEEDGFRPSTVSSPTFAAGTLNMPPGGNAPTGYGNVAAWLSTSPASTLKSTDATWMPLGAPGTNSSGLGKQGKLHITPGFPAYPSGHATFGSTAFGVAGAFLNAIGADSNATFTMVSDEFNGMNVDPDGSARPLHKRRMTLAQAIHENASSRVYLGVHWTMDAVEGVRLGQDILAEMKKSPMGPAFALQTANV